MDDASHDLERPDDTRSSGEVEGVSGRRSTSSLRRVFVVVLVSLVVADQVVKYIAEQVLERGRFVPWLSEEIGWQLVYNDGAAFGLPLPWWVFPVVASLVVVVVWRTLPRLTRLVPVVAYGMLVAGAIGNVVDRVVRTGDPGDPRVLHGHVVDFVAWGAFPRFNVADAAITVGFVLLAWDLVRHGDDGLADEPRSSDPVTTSSSR